MISWASWTRFRPWKRRANASASERSSVEAAVRCSEGSTGLTCAALCLAVRGMFDGMDREFLEKALVTAERHVARGEALITRQRATIVALERTGHNVALAKECLCVFEQCQSLHVSDRDRLRKDLQNANRS
jgi:hypothetical protein